MKEKLESFYRLLAGKYPALGNMIRRIYFRKPINTVKKQIKGQRNEITYGHAILSAVIFDIKGHDNVIRIADGCVLNNVLFHVQGDHHQIAIGAGCRFHGGGSIWLEDSGGSLEIGANSTFEDVHIAVTEPHSKVIIGNDCMFSSDIDIRTGDSHSILDAGSGARINYAQDIKIGNHVWVAAHSIILKGVAIADDCVVATGSVVVKSVTEPGVILAGNPAAIVRRNITWARERLYQSG